MRWAGSAWRCQLSDDDDMLEHAPTGAADAVNAGMRQIIVGMTETNLLGTVRLEVATDISPIQLDAERFRLSAPERATVTIAAGDGAEGLELARVGLTVVDAAIRANIVGPTSFTVGNLFSLSLDILPSIGIQTVVFYLDSAPDGDGIGAAEIVVLTVSSSNTNYTQFLQSVTLNIQALENPDVAEYGGVAGSSNPYFKGNLHNFKDGDYKNATAFERDDAASDRQLTVDANGIVSTNENINAPGTYNLVVSVTSPDFVGKARLALRLNLGAEDTLTPDRTILSDQREKDVVVVPGYSGSVAFFAAATMGVTLQTPADPADFSFGTDGANRDYASPDGFTLFLDANQVDDARDTAVAEFVVTAKAAGLHVSGNLVDGDGCGADASESGDFGGERHGCGLRHGQAARRLFA